MGIVPGVERARSEMAVFEDTSKPRDLVLQKFFVQIFAFHNVDGRPLSEQRSAIGANTFDIPSAMSISTTASANCNSAPTSAVTNIK